MDNYAKYFSKVRPRAKWHLGDRVFGFYNKIPFVGTVLLDNMIREEDGSRVIVQLDLPLKYKKQYRNLVEVKQKDLKKLTQF